MYTTNKKVLIGEDNVLIAEHLRDIVISFGYNVVGIFHNKIDILLALKTLNPDIALLDINMETKYTGVEIGEYILKKMNIPFIYITAHSEKITVKKALKTKPSGYILKPFKEPEISIAIELAFEKFSKLLADGFFIIKDNAISIKVFYTELIFIKSNNNYIEIFTTKHNYLIRGRLKDIMSDLDKNIFIQTHRSYIINKNFALNFKKNYLLVKDISIPVSRKYLNTVKAIFA